MADEKIDVITLGGKELSPEQEREYRDHIAAAKKASPLTGIKGSTPVGVEPKPQMPRFQQGPPTGGVHPRPAGAPVLRPETARQVAEAVEAGQKIEQQERDQKTLDEKKLEEDAKLEKLFQALNLGDQQSQVERILDNKKRKEEIEARCMAMNLEDLILKDEVSQRVPIVPEKFEPVFRSITPIESLYLKSRLAKETVQTDQYIGEKYNIMLLTCSLVSINGALLPEHRVHRPDGGFEVTDSAFDTKLSVILRKSGYIVADLAVNYQWFDVRVRKLLNPDDLGNG